MLAPVQNRQIDGIAPTFLKKPAIRQLDDGKRLMFECLIKADPMPLVRWSHNDVAVEEDSNGRHKVLISLFMSFMNIFSLINNPHFFRTDLRSKGRLTVLCCT